MLFTRTLGLTIAIASIFLTDPKGINAASVPLFDNMESIDTSEELLPLTTTFKEFNWKGDSVYAGQTFIVSLDEPAQFQVTDYKNKGDHFDIYDNRLWIGRTSTVELLRDIHGFARTPRHAIGDSHFSQGVFGLGKGTHIITIKATSPYGEGSGAIRLITGIDGEDNVNVEGDYLPPPPPPPPPPPIEHSSSEGNSTNTNTTVLENDSSHGKNSSVPINSSDNSIQNQVEDEDEHNDRDVNNTKNDGGDDSEDADEDNENNNEDDTNDNALDNEINNSTSISYDSEDTPVSTNATSTATSSLRTVTRSFKSYSTVISTVVLTVYADEPSSKSSIAPQTTGSVVATASEAAPSQTPEPSVASASQAAPSQTPEPSFASASEASISQATNPASTSSAASEED